MSNQSTARSGGIGVAGLLGVVFVTLKLIGIIDWSWWWVTLPFWGGAAIVVASVVIWLIVAIVVIWLIVAIIVDLPKWLRKK